MISEIEHVVDEHVVDAVLDLVRVDLPGLIVQVALRVEVDAEGRDGTRTRLEGDRRRSSVVVVLATPRRFLVGKKAITSASVGRLQRRAPPASLRSRGPGRGAIRSTDLHHRVGLLRRRPCRARAFSASSTRSELTRPYRAAGLGAGGLEAPLLLASGGAEAGCQLRPHPHAGQDPRPEALSHQCHHWSLYVAGFGSSLRGTRARYPGTRSKRRSGDRPLPSLNSLRLRADASPRRRRGSRFFFLRLRNPIARIFGLGLASFLP